MKLSHVVAHKRSRQLHKSLHARTIDGDRYNKVESYNSE